MYTRRRFIVTATGLAVASTGTFSSAADKTPIKIGQIGTGHAHASGKMAVSGVSIAMEFGSEAERPGYIAIYNTVFMPLLLAGPVVGGLMRDYVGVTQSFFAAIALGLVGWAILVLRVKEPRKPESAAETEGTGPFTGGRSR